MNTSPNAYKSKRCQIAHNHSDLRSCTSFSHSAIAGYVIFRQYVEIWSGDVWLEIDHFKVKFENALKATIDHCKPPTVLVQS